MSREMVICMGCGFILVALVLIYLLFGLWPTEIKNSGSWEMKSHLFFWKDIYLSQELRLLFLVMISGAIGSYIHTVTSFATYLGNRKMCKSWFWWYILRTPIGISIAIIIYFVIRGGILSANASPSTFSPFGIIAVCGLGGMFSKNAIDKMREVFETLFRTKEGRGDSERLNKLT